MLEINKPFLLFSCCILTKGYTRTVIADLQRNMYDFIPNSLYEIIVEFNSKTIHLVLSEFPKKEDQDVVLEYFTFLYENEYLFFTDNPENFPSLRTQFETPSLITNAIIDIGTKYMQFDYKDVINQLSNLGCKAVQIRIYEKVDISFLKELINFDSNNRIRDVQLIIKDDSYEDSAYDELYNSNVRLSSIDVHSSLKSETKNLSDKIGLCSINFSDKKLTNSSHCGVISSNYFSVNVDTYTEGLNFNSCLNKKIGIDIEGNIKNCPTMNESYGNILDEKLSEVLENTEVKKMWTITKNDIIDCKMCEFRNICTDCRASFNKNMGLYDKPEKCKYDPYIGEWKKL